MDASGVVVLDHLGHDPIHQREQRRATCAAEVYGMVGLGEEVRQPAAEALGAQKWSIPKTFVPPRLSNGS